MLHMYFMMNDLFDDKYTQFTWKYMKLSIKSVNINNVLLWYMKKTGLLDDIIYRVDITVMPTW